MKTVDGMSACNTTPLLSLENVSLSYKSTSIVRDMSLTVLPHQIVAIVGPNGAGKTTILKAIGGLIRPVQGQILFEGERIESLQVWDIVKRGIVYVPEGMNVFRDMTVTENLEIGAYLNRPMIPERMERVFSLFPELWEKRQAYAGTLSGGQRRMVILARGLMSGARLLLLDDPFLGLCPKVMKRFCEAFRTLRQSGLTLLIAGQHVRRILNVADLAFLLEDGTITLSGPGMEVFNNSHLQEILFGSEAGLQLSE